MRFYSLAAKTDRILRAEYARLPTRDGGFRLQKRMSQTLKTSKGPTCDKTGSEGKYSKGGLLFLEKEQIFTVRYRLERNERAGIEREALRGNFYFVGFPAMINGNA